MKKLKNLFVSFFSYSLSLNKYNHLIHYLFCDMLLREDFCIPWKSLKPIINNFYYFESDSLKHHIMCQTNSDLRKYFLLCYFPERFGVYKESIHVKNNSCNHSKKYKYIKLLYRHTLREVLWLVDIIAELLRDTDSEEPHRDQWEKWRKEWMRGRHLDTIIVEIIHSISDSDDSEDDTVSGFDFLDIGRGLLSHHSLEVQYDRRHRWIHECEGTMLQLTCGVALSMQIGEFLQLQ